MQPLLRIYLKILSLYRLRYAPLIFEVIALEARCFQKGRIFDHCLLRLKVERSSLHLTVCEKFQKFAKQAWSKLNTITYQGKENDAIQILRYDQLICCLYGK